MAALFKEVTPYEIEQIKKTENCTNKKIAELLEVSPSMISKAIGKRHYGSAPTYQQIIEAEKSGYSQKEIAELYSVCTSTLARVKRNHMKASETPKEEPKPVPVAKSPDKEPAKVDTAPKPVIKPEPVRRTATGFRKVTSVKYTGDFIEGTIISGGGFRFKIQFCDQPVFVYYDQLTKLVNDLTRVKNYISANIMPEGKNEQN